MGPLVSGVTVSSSQRHHLSVPSSLMWATAHQDDSSHTFSQRLLLNPKEQTVDFEDQIKLMWFYFQVLQNPP